MRAFVLESLDAPPALRDDLPAPTPTDEQVLVRVRSSSVNPVDAFIASGALAQGVEHEFPVVLGRDFAGVVERVGADVTRFRDGDEVFGFLTHANPTVRDGSWCELIVVPETDSAWEKPRDVGLPEAGAAPLAAITALAALDALALEPGETVLAVGATGGVGSFFVQLAAAAGAHVIATALAEDHGYLEELGVDELVDRSGDVPGAVRAAHPGGVAALLDLATQAPDTSVLAEGGRVASPRGAAGEGPGRFNVTARPTQANLLRLAQLLDDGTLRVPIQRTYDLADAGAALQALTATHTQGKLGVTIA